MKEIITLYLVSLFTRLSFLFFGHQSITNDEADYFINSWLVAKTGKDIFGNRFFLSSGILFSTSAIPIYIGSLFFLVFPKTILFSRLPYALFNSFTPVLLYILVKKLTKNRSFSLIAFSVLNFSPWFSYLSAQSAFDSPLSLMFFLAGVVILLTKIGKKLKQILFLLFLFLSFNSYMGIKVAFIFFIFTGLLIEKIYFKEKINFKKIAKMLTYSAILFLTMVVLLFIFPNHKNFSGRLQNEIIILNKPAIAQEVNNRIALLKGPIIIKRILINKATILFSIFTKKYLTAFNPILLFINGDPHPIYGTNTFGLFYIFDFLFFIVSIYVIKKEFEKKLSVLFPFLIILFISPITIAISKNNPSLAMRGFPLLVPYSFFIAYGAYYLGKKIFNKPEKIIFILYLFSFFYFFALFQTEIKFTSSEQWHHSEKVLINRLYKVSRQRNKKVIVYLNEPKDILLQYLFYKENDANKIKTLLNRDTFAIDNISFISNCPKKKLKDTIQIVKRFRCDGNMKSFETKPFVSDINRSDPSYLLIK